MIQVDLNLIRLLCWAYDEINGHITHNTYNDEFELWEGQDIWIFIYECINDMINESTNKIVDDYINDMPNKDIIKNMLNK